MGLWQRETLNEWLKQPLALQSPKVVVMYNFELWAERWLSSSGCLSLSWAEECIS